MGHKDWDPDELLDFDYRKPVPDRNPETGIKGLSSGNDAYDEFKRYEALRHKDNQRASSESLSRGKAPASASAPRKSKTPAADAGAGMPRMSREDSEAVKKARDEAYNRYKSTYEKNKSKKSRPRKTGRNAGAKTGQKASLLTRFLSLIYLAAAVAFCVALTIMDIIPGRMLFALYAVLGLLSLIIVTQLRKGGVRRWVRTLASLTAVALIVVFGFGTSYAMGTLSFLNFTSVENDKKVGSVTNQPFNVCMTGIDTRGEIDTEGRSDVNMIVTVNPKTATILMTSIPRDYQIYMPDKDYALDKLTHTGFYSVETTILAEEDLLDTEMNYFVKVNFSTVEKFIDAIGGIDVYSEFEFNPVKLKDWTVKEGVNHMNGKQALAFARERKAFPTGDNQRIKNQQAVFEAMIKKATSSPAMLISYNKVIANLKDYFRMSFSSAEMRALIKYQVAKNPEWKIYKNSITGGDGMMGTYSTGSAAAYVMTQDQYSIENAKTLINAVMNGEKLAKDDDGKVYVATEESEGSGE